MRICHVNFGRYPGQGNTAIMQFTRHLTEAGHDVNAIVWGGMDQPKKEKINGVLVQRVHFGRESSKRFDQPRFMLSASKKINEFEEFDIIHVYSSTGASILPITSSNDGKWVLDIRTGGLTGGLNTFLGNWLKKLEARFFDRTLVIDEMLGQRLLPKGDYDVLPLGVDTKTFDCVQVARNQIRKELGLQESTVLVYVGDMSPLRNLHRLIESFAMAMERIDKNLKLLMVGTGPDVSKLKNLSKKLGVEENVVFIGYVDHEQVPNYLSAADIGLAYIPINPVYDLQPPTKTLEYLACQLPVVATNTKGNKRFIEEGKNGVLVNDEPEGFVQGMINVIQRGGDLSHKTIADEHSWESITEKKLLPIYKSLISE